MNIVQIARNALNELRHAHALSQIDDIAERIFVTGFVEGYIRYGMKQTPTRKIEEVRQESSYQMAGVRHMTEQDRKVLQEMLRMVWLKKQIRAPKKRV